MPIAECYFEYSSSEDGIVLGYTNPNSYTVSVPLTNMSTNGDGSKNEIDDINESTNPAVVNLDPGTSGLPTSFAPGRQNDAAVFEINSSDSSPRIAWELIANQQTEQNVIMFDEGGGTPPYAISFAGDPEAAVSYPPMLSLCSASDAARARQMLLERHRLGHEGRG